MEIELFYPNFSKKAVSFTLDDGNLKYDMPLIEIFRKHGIVGTFNLSCTRQHLADKEKYKEIYAGFGIANHCAYHPHAFDDDIEYDIADEPFDPETADPTKIYPSGKGDGFHLWRRPLGWRRIATPERYIESVVEASEVLEEIFERPINGYVWPFFSQNSKKVRDYVFSHFISTRRTGAIGTGDRFNLPDTFIEWSYNATEKNLLPLAEEYMALADDGELKLFTFGVHSVDYIRAEKVDELESVCERFGSSPDKYYTDAVDDIFDYVTAARSLEFGEGYVKNPSDIAVYLLVDGVKTILPGGEEINESNKSRYAV